MENIAFLTYISRSGSTYLARLLNEYDDIGVSIEARLPDGILYRSLEITRSQDVEKALEVLFSDGKFRAWNLRKDELERELRRLGFPIGYDKLLRTLLKMYFKKDNVRICIYKNGYYMEHVEALRSIFPDARFIFLVRDVRAIYNSQKHSLNSETLRPMASNPILVAKYYEKILSIIEKYRQCDWLHVLKYEDLLLNTDDEIVRLLSFLGSRGTRIADVDYYDQLPETEKHLHRNVNSGPLTDRMTAWRDQLSKVEMTCIQNVARDELARYQYDLVHCDRIPTTVWIGYLAFWLKYCGSVCFSIVRFMGKKLRLRKGERSRFYAENLIGWSSRP